MNMALCHVVDDDTAVLRAAELALMQLGHVVRGFTGVASYPEQLLAPDGVAPDLLVIDLLSMPDPAQYLQRLREKPALATLPILVTSAIAVRDGALVISELRERLGVYAVLQKPFSPRTLAEEVSRALQPGALQAAPASTAVRATLPIAQIAVAPTAQTRVEPRYEASFEVAFATRDEFVKEYTQNISRGGLFVRTLHVPALRSHVRLVIHVPDDPEPLDLVATVAHVAPPGGEEPSGFGVMLAKADQQVLDRWQRAVTGIEQRKGIQSTGPKVFLLGFANEAAAELMRSAGMLCRQDVSLVPMASWQSVIAQVKRSESKRKLLLIDLSNTSRRAELMSGEMLTLLAAEPECAVAYLGLQPNEPINAPETLRVIRSATLTPTDLLGAVVHWLDLPIRHDVRVPVTSTARIVAGTQTIIGAMMDVSIGGARVLASAPVEPGTQAQLEFGLLPAGVVSLPCDVRWAKPEGRGRTMCGMAFRIDATHPALAKLRAYVEEQSLLLRSLENLRRNAQQTQEIVTKIIEPPHK